METSTSQAVQLGTNLRFLNRIFQNPNSKCLLGCAQTPCILHPVDAGCAFLQNAFLIRVPMPVVSALFVQIDSRKQIIVLCSTSGIVLYLIT